MMINKPKKILLLLSVIVLLGMLVFSGCKNDDSPKTKESHDNEISEDAPLNYIGDYDPPPPLPQLPPGAEVVEVPNQHTALWVELDGGTSELSMINNSELIARGVVISSYVKTVGGDDNVPGMPFTYSVVSIKEIFGINTNAISTLKSSIDEKKLEIEVRQTGDKDYVLHDAPLLIEGKEYLFFLNKESEFPHFAPVGGRLGIAEINGSGNLNFTNKEAAEMNLSFQGKNLDNIYESFEQLEEKVDSNIMFNTNTKALAKELGWKEKSLSPK